VFAVCQEVPIAMASHVVGYPRMGPKRELKFALESFWEGKTSAADLEAVAKDLRASIWKQMVDAGVTLIPSNTFSYYDQVLDTTALVGAVPPLYGWTGGDIGLDIYFSMARGNATKPAMEMTKWFDTNYHFIVPELGPETKFSCSSRKAVNEYKEAKELGIETVPVLVGPVTYLLLAKAQKGAPKGFDLLSLLDSILPVYKEAIGELKEAGAKWVQLDEPALVLDLEASKLEAFKKAYSFHGADLGGVKLLLETYFADIPAAAYKTIIDLEHVSAIGVDLVRGAKTLDLIKEFGVGGKIIFAGVVDGRNIWANDLAASLNLVEELQRALGKGI
jgi:5-methyltetrahydropteroyltriglutamate--homocysteine methyltransferase